MIGVSVSDIIKLLEQVPGWKAVAGLPKRLAELEARVKVLETGCASAPSPPPGAKDCPLCGAVMRVTAERPHVHFGPQGMKTHTMLCDGCGHTAERMYSPAKGYV
jgi:hypothetical protein